jgi:hypothetical protein
MAVERNKYSIWEVTFSMDLNQPDMSQPMQNMGVAVSLEAVLYD